MPNPNLAELVIIMDRSGSMEIIKDAMQEGFNQFIVEQRKIPDPCDVTFYRFDTVVEKVFEARPLAQVENMLLEPRGGTALFDAMGQAITEVGTRLSLKPDEERPGKVIVMIITDGHNNASKEYTLELVAGMVKHQTDIYNWQFAFLGANIDSFAAGADLNIAAANVQNFASTPTGVNAMYGATSASVGNYRSNKAVNAKLGFDLTNKTP